MGIDKSNVRYVIHYNMPQSMESYYQGSWTCGPGWRTFPVYPFLFSAQDIMINKFLLENKDFSDLSAEEIEIIKQRDSKRLKTMENYCRSTGRLRNYILNYFGRKGFKTLWIIAVIALKTIKSRYDRSKQVINCVTETRGRYGITILLGTLMGSESS